MQTTWFISGGCGFIGRNLVRSLVSRAKVGVRIFDNCAVGTREDLARVCSFQECGADAQPPNPGEVQLIVGDITDEESLRHALCHEAIVVHLAANTGVPLSVENPCKDFTSNVFGTFTLLEAARGARAQRVIFASSGAPAGECEPPVSERVVPRPISPYGASKLAGEGYCSAYYHSFGLETVALRFSNVYGPYSGHKSSVVAKFINAALRGDPWEVYGDGSQTRDFLYIDDLVKAVHAAAETPRVGGEVFQIASGKETNVLTLTNLLSHALKRHGQTVPQVIFRPKRTGDVSRNFADPAKAKLQLHWESSTELCAGVDATVAWFLTMFSVSARRTCGGVK